MHREMNMQNVKMLSEVFGEKNINKNEIQEPQSKSFILKSCFSRRWLQKLKFRQQISSCDQMNQQVSLWSWAEICVCVWHLFHLI